METIDHENNGNKYINNTIINQLTSTKCFFRFIVLNFIIKKLILKI